MYIPEHFEVTDIKLIHDLIRAYPLATVVVSASNGLNANHIPLHLIDTQKPYGRLCGHVARANPLLSEIADGNESLAIFHGSNAYISPSWYASKQEHGKVVPTWNYVVVHAYGQLRVVDDRDWVSEQLEALTDANEAGLPESWAVADAPADFTRKLLQSIVGLEMTITKLIGKWKVSQNQPEQNQNSVVAGLNTQKQPHAFTMAELINQHKVKEKS